MPDTPIPPPPASSPDSPTPPPDPVPRAASRARRSEAQRRASRANGRKSAGPTTPQGKATSSANATVHGGYARRPVIRTGVFKEDPEEYEQDLSAFVQAVRPVNALARQQAVRVFHEYRKLDRIDRFEVEALEHAGRMPTPDPDFDLKVARATSSLDSAIDRVELWADLLDRHDHDPAALHFVDWGFLLALADDPALADLQEQVAHADDDPAARAALTPMLRSAIEKSLTTQHGSVGQALEARIAAEEAAVRYHTTERAALKEPPTESEFGARVAFQLVNGGFFDRLSRPRSTSRRAIRHEWERFTECQAMGPDPKDETDPTRPLVGGPA